MTQHFEQGASADAKEMSLHTKMRQSKLSVECANSKNDSFLWDAKAHLQLQEQNIQKNVEAALSRMRVTPTQDLHAEGGNFKLVFARI